jgi:hypothetical protein
MELGFLLFYELFGLLVLSWLYGFSSFFFSGKVRFVWLDYVDIAGMRLQFKKTSA